MIVHRLLENVPMGFNALMEAVDGIYSKLLSDSLDDLEDNELIKRAIVSEKSFRVKYSLTERGKSLDSVIYEMQDWGIEHFTSPANPETPGFRLQ